MKFILDFFILITGISAASGLYYQDDKLFIVSDNSNYLYEYQLSSQNLQKHLLVDMEDQNEQVQKKIKLDLEAMTFYEDSFWLFPSGSASNRTQSFRFFSQDSTPPTRSDLSEFYTNLQEQLSISPADFNIEGSLYYQDTLLLFNRGNGPNAINGIIKIDLSLGAEPTFHPVTLPRLNGQISGFTDAVLVDDKIYFLAAAEKGASSYHDGAIGGSQLGVIDIATLKIDQITTISDNQKFEGITLYRSTEKELTFLLCEDPDNNENKSTIYQLRLSR
ncbi:DUF6929 family protein [Sphingobacterium yanglingense]|uniref:Phytase-like protein with esterase activity n=1 Tax=Sphingobacterium yanglingense TaxID=1437280 RepID=A0A4R6WI35_9SPHI|nr:hypothetical protein [Sphingobacterium yanglingense]TDQ79824.1 hypothetical protein CLV99_1274 [Sphingobacterium yanglingense]